MRRTAIFFHYYEKDISYRDNLVYFISAAYRTDVIFFIVISGECTVELPEIFNIEYIFTENKNSDYGAYTHAFSKIKNQIDQFDFFIFINSSVRGPFLSYKYKNDWLSIFYEKFDQDTHLVGGSINILSENYPYSIKFNQIFDFPKPYSHVQTNVYALTWEALKHLLEIDFFNFEEKINKTDVILKYEIRLSQEIKNVGWNMKSLLSKYNNIDFRKKHFDINHSSRNGDPLYKGAYFGRTAKPKELVFIKTNRDLISRTNLIWITFKGLNTIDHDAIISWSEYKRMKKRYSILFSSLPYFFIKEFLFFSKNKLKVILKRFFNNF